jgi:hypothetical protein
VLSTRHFPAFNRAYDALYNKATFSCAFLGELGYLLLALCLISLYTLEQQGHVRRQLLAKLQDLSTAQHTTHTDDHAALVISTGAAGCPAEQPESERQGVHGLGQAKSHGSTQADHGATSSADGSTCSDKA